MAALTSDWLRHFRLLLCNRWTEFNETWQEARSQRPLPSLCFSGRSEKQDGHPGLWLAETFLAHLSQRLKWAIVIAHRPSSVSPSSVCPSVVVRPSVNFHIFNFFSRTAWWILMKLGRDEVFMVPYKCCCFSARSAQGRIQGGTKIGQRGSPSSRNFFFRPEGYSDKPNG